MTDEASSQREFIMMRKRENTRTNALRQRTGARCATLGMILVATAASACRDLPQAPDVGGLRPSWSLAPADRAHEPHGFVRITERGFDAFQEDGWLWGGRPALYSTVTVPTAPRSAEHVGRQTFPTGFAGGSSPVVLERGFPGTRDIYVTFWFRVSDAWQGHPVYNNVIRLWIAGQPRFYWGFHGADDQPLRPRAAIQATPTPPDGARWFDPNVMSAAVVRGQWHRVELVIRTNSAGNADGQYHCWLDGVKVAEYRDVLYVGPGEGREWIGIQWAPSWGGLGGTVAHEQWMDMDHLYVSGLGDDPIPIWPHEPAGYEQITDQPFESLTSLGWGIAFNERGGVTTEIDPTAPLSPATVARFAYPVGFRGGRAPGTQFLDFPGRTGLFIGTWWKPSDPWEGHPSNVNKVQFLFPSNGAGNLTLVMYGPPGGPYELRTALQFKRADRRIWLVPNVHNVAVTLGEWHRIEWQVTYHTASDPPNGVVRWWLDGELVGDYRDVLFPTEPLGQFQLSPTWGGVDGVKSQDDFFWYDHVYVSGR